MEPVAWRACAVPCSDSGFRARLNTDDQLVPSRPGSISVVAIVAYQHTLWRLLSVQYTSCELLTRRFDAQTRRPERSLFEVRLHSSIRPTQGLFFAERLAMPPVRARPTSHRLNHSHTDLARASGPQERMSAPCAAHTAAISALARVLTGRRRRLFMWHQMRVWPAKPVSAVWVSLLGMLYEPSTVRHAGVGLVSNAERCGGLAEPTKNELVLDAQ